MSMYKIKLLLIYSFNYIIYYFTNLHIENFKRNFIKIKDLLKNILYAMKHIIYTLRYTKN